MSSGIEPGERKANKKPPLGEPGVAVVVRGRARGIEPPNGGTTSRCLNRLATPAAWVKRITGAFSFPRAFGAGAQGRNGPRSPIRAAPMRQGGPAAGVPLARAISAIVGRGCWSLPCLPAPSKPALLSPAPRQLAPESFGALQDASGSNPLILPSASPIPCWFAGRHRPRPPSRTAPRWVQ